MDTDRHILLLQSREVVKAISLELLPDLAQSEREIRVSCAFIDPVLDALAAGELPIVQKGSEKGGAFGGADLLAIVLVPAVASAVITILIQFGITTVSAFWQQSRQESKSVLLTEIRPLLNKVNPNLSDREIDQLANKVVQEVWDYLSRREAVVNALLEEMSEGLAPTEVAELRQKLDKHFNESELKDLCFDMGIVYEQFQSGTKRDKVRQILAYCLRHRRVSDLRAACRQARPTVSW